MVGLLQKREVGGAAVETAILYGGGIYLFGVHFAERVVGVCVCVEVFVAVRRELSFTRFLGRAVCYELNLLLY